MHPLLKELQRDNDPHDVLEITPDIVLAARADHELPTLAPGTVRHPAEPPIHVEPKSAAAPSLTTFRADSADRAPVAGERTPRRKWVTRTLVAFLLALGSGAAAEGWRHYGDTARQMIAHWTPWTVATSANPAPPEQPTSPDAQAAAPTAAAPAQVALPAPSAEAAASDAAPDQAQTLQAMAQQIEQLKASIEQLKAGQEQMARDLAKASEAKAAITDARVSDPNPRPRIAAPRLSAQPRAVVAQPVRKPRPTFGAAQTALPPPLPPIAAAPAPLPAEPAPQATVETDGNPVVRPPMPLR